jgi:hypothetical protein
MFPGGYVPAATCALDRLIHMNYAVPPPEVDIASGRVEDSRSFSQKHSRCECFWEKDKQRTMLPQAKRP